MTDDRVAAVKARLRDYRDQAAELAQLRELIGGLQDSKGDPRPGHYIAPGYDRRERLEARYHAKAEELAAELLSVEELLEGLPPRERVVLRCYYVQGLTWEQACEAVHYSWRQIHRIHSGALIRLAAGTAEK